MSRALSDDLPSRHDLEAALRVSQLVKDGIWQVDRVRAGYTQLATDGIYGYDDLRRGEEILIRAGLLHRESGKLIGDSRLYTIRALGREAVEVILGLFLRYNRPSWIATVVSESEVREEYIPSRMRRRLNDIFRDESQRDAFLTSARISPESSTSEIGQLGEEEVLRACRKQRRDAGYPELARGVRQVSEVSDHFGYDISAPCPEGNAYHLEVKTVGYSSGPTRFHLTRNQYTVGVRDSKWKLVVCRKESDQVSIVGWSNAKQVWSQIPEEQDGESGCTVRWEELRIRLSNNRLRAGLPPLKLR
jgi:hypothetical protein